MSVLFGGSLEGRVGGVGRVLARPSKLKTMLESLAREEVVGERKLHVHCGQETDRSICE